MSRERDPEAPDLDPRPAERVGPKELRWAMRCSRCSVDVLAYCTDRFLDELRARAEQHNAERPGHDATVVPRYEPPTLRAAEVAPPPAAAVDEVSVWPPDAIDTVLGPPDPHAACPDAGCGPGCPARVDPPAAPPQPCEHDVNVDADGLPLSVGEVCARCGSGPKHLPPAAAQVDLNIDAGEVPSWLT